MWSAHIVEHCACCEVADRLRVCYRVGRWVTIFFIEQIVDAQTHAVNFVPIALIPELITSIQTNKRIGWARVRPFIIVACCLLVYLAFKRVIPVSLFIADR